VWKSAVSKYTYEELTCAEDKPLFAKLAGRYSKHVPADLRTAKIDAYDSQITDCCDAYENTTSKCARCARTGNHVGRNFRPCKTKKEWVRLQNNVAAGTVDLVRDFHDYPKQYVPRDGVKPLWYVGVPTTPVVAAGNLKCRLYNVHTERIKTNNVDPTIK